jgi:uncharacterized membrane protein
MEDTRIRVEAHEGGFALLSRRNCSMAPASLLALLAVIALVNLGIGAAFALLGFWLVLPFAGIEVLALAAAFRVWARHAGDYERVALADGRLRLEVCEAQTLRTYELNPAWVSVVAGRRQGTMRLALRSHGREIEIGRHLDEAGRERFAALLRERIGASLGSATTRTR